MFLINRPGEESQGSNTLNSKFEYSNRVNSQKRNAAKSLTSGGYMMHGNEKYGFETDQSASGKGIFNHSKAFSSTNEDLVEMGLQGKRTPAEQAYTDLTIGDAYK